MEIKLEEIIKTTYDMDESKFDIWKKHRESISNLIKRGIIDKIGELESIVIFGAGNCNDIDLNFLINNFKKITLIDINKNIMIKALERQEINRSENITMLEIDLLKQDKNIFRDFQQLLISKVNFKRINKFLINEIDNIMNKDIVFKNLEKHSVGVCLGVHSQLFIKFLAILNEYKKDYDKKEIKRIEETINYCQAKTALRMNDIATYYVSNALFIGFDLMEISIERNLKYLPFIMKSLEKKEVTKVIELAMRNSVSGAVNGYEDMNKRILNGELNVDVINCWLWHFSREKKYVFVTETILKDK